MTHLTEVKSMGIDRGRGELIIRLKASVGRLAHYQSDKEAPYSLEQEIDGRETRLRVSTMDGNSRGGHVRLFGFAVVHWFIQLTAGSLFPVRLLVIQFRCL